MLSKFKYQAQTSVEDFEQAYTTLEQALNPQARSTEADLSTLLDTFFAMKVAYQSMNRRLTHAKNPVQIKNEIIDFGFNGFADLVDKPMMMNTADAGIRAYQSLEKQTEAGAIENIWLETQLVLMDTQTLARKLKMLKSKNNVVAHEIAILKKLLQKLIEPMLDPNFKRIKHFYTFHMTPAGQHFTWIKINTASEEFEGLRNALSLKETLDKLFDEKKAAFTAAHQSEAFADFCEEFDKLSFELTYSVSVYNLLISTLQEKDRVNDATSMLPLWRELVHCLDRTEQLNERLRQIIQNLKKLKPKQHKLLAVKPSVPILSLPKIAEISSVLLSDDSEMDTTDEESSSEALTSTDSSEEETVAIDPMYFKNWDKAPKPVTPLSDLKTEENEDILTFKMNGTPKKVIQKIYEGSTKVEYDDVLALFKALQGSINEKTGSSSRKFKAFDQRMFTHKRHGRDRKKYIDPKAIKNVKDLLVALDVTPDNLELKIKVESVDIASSRKASLSGR